jgi:hypothetical protein
LIFINILISIGGWYKGDCNWTLDWYGTSIRNFVWCN